MSEDALSFYDEEAEGSSTNIIRLRDVEQLGLQDQVIPASRVLNGFNTASEPTKEEIVLPVNVDGTIQDTKFHVIYNMKAIPSTLHLIMKFLTEDGVKTVYGEQHAAKEMFAVEEVTPAPMPSTSEKSGTKDKPAAK
uniref:Uncharacterized protein n=1 Tax=Nicotiana tabacum TaxID=4097 RepID=A0A1S3ZI69_TOBAC|nr:PREDICTED: uncharacterized protein LOC107787132 [Nicotiana tabacum]